MRNFSSAHDAHTVFLYSDHGNCECMIAIVLTVFFFMFVGFLIGNAEMASSFFYVSAPKKKPFDGPSNERILKINHCNGITHVFPSKLNREQTNQLKETNKTTKFMKMLTIHRQKRSSRLIRPKQTPFSMAFHESMNVDTFNSHFSYVVTFEFWAICVSINGAKKGKWKNKAHIVFHRRIVSVH